MDFYSLDLVFKDDVQEDGSFAAVDTVVVIATNEREAKEKINKVIEANYDGYVPITEVSVADAITFVNGWKRHYSGVVRA